MKRVFYRYFFTPCKAEKPLQGIEFQEKGDKVEAFREAVQKEPKDRKCLLTLD